MAFSCLAFFGSAFVNSLNWALVSDTVDYGDGTTLDIWQVPLENPANDWTDGPFFRCTFPSGKTYGYDTDQIPMTRLTRLFS